MITKNEYLKHEIMEEGWIRSATIPNAFIYVCSRVGWDDYSQAIVKYVNGNKEIYFKLVKGLPTFEQFKDLIVFDKISDEDIKEVYEFIISPDNLSNIATYYCAKELFKSMEYEKIPLETYLTMLNNGELANYTGL